MHMNRKELLLIFLTSVSRFYTYNEIMAQQAAFDWLNWNMEDDIRIHSFEMQRWLPKTFMLMLLVT